jgi:hypothetical protein
MGEQAQTPTTQPRLQGCIGQQHVDAEMGARHAVTTPPSFTTTR